MALFKLGAYLGSSQFVSALLFFTLGERIKMKVLGGFLVFLPFCPSESLFCSLLDFNLEQNPFVSLKNAIFWSVFFIQAESFQPSRLGALLFFTS